MGRRNRQGTQKYFVSRQIYWGIDSEPFREDGKYEDATYCQHVVEVAVGGQDYANPNMIAERWSRLGEGNEFEDPREAIEAAIQIRNEWKKNPPLGDEDGKPVRIEVVFGSTGGNTIPFEVTLKTGDDDIERASDEELQAKGERIWEKLPKCAECGELLGEEKYGDPNLGEFNCCSERCAEKHYGDPEGRDEEETDDEEYPVEQPEKF